MRGRRTDIAPGTLKKFTDPSNLSERHLFQQSGTYAEGPIWSQVKIWRRP